MKAERKSPLKSIRTFCKRCAGSLKAVRTCLTPDCDLFPYRMGRDPARKGVGGNPNMVKKPN